MGQNRPKWTKNHPKWGQNRSILPFSRPDFSKVAEPALTKSIRCLENKNCASNPGGKFVFLEHGLSDSTKVQVWQHRLNPLQKIIGDGCHLNRDMDQLVRGAAFEMTSLKRFQIPLLPRFIGHCYQGIAVKV